MCVFVCVSVRLRKNVCVCVCERERESVCFRKSVYVCTFVCVRWNLSVLCMCVCV